MSPANGGSDVFNVETIFTCSHLQTFNPYSQTFCDASVGHLHALRLDEILLCEQALAVKILRLGERKHGLCGPGIVNHIQRHAVHSDRNDFQAS